MLKVRAQKLGDVAVLSLQGRIVTEETHMLRDVVSSLSETSVVVLDFARVSGIDAHGLGVLLELRWQLELKGIEFRLMNVTNLVGEVLAITKLDTVFQLTTEAHTLSTTAGNQLCETDEFALMSDD